MKPTLYESATRGIASASLSSHFELTTITPDCWFYDAHRALVAAVSDRTFPCHFGTEALLRGGLFFTSVSSTRTSELTKLAEVIDQFATASAGLPMRSALIAFVDTRGSEQLAEDEATFWRVLRYLYHESNSADNDDPSTPQWSFPFRTHRLFFNGHSPHYHRRRSRSATDTVHIVIQTVQNLGLLTGQSRQAVAAANEIRAKVDRYDAIPRSPQLAHHGTPDNLDWRQFWLLDSNRPDTRTCPLMKDNPHGAP
jgi:FPC/CPF motif-containing protein YcgG